jgi:hypothetical protein
MRRFLRRAALVAASVLFVPAAALGVLVGVLYEWGAD